MKANAVAAAANVAGMSVPAAASNVIMGDEFTRLTWNKAPCRFCGVGCSVNVATLDGKVVATHGDINSPVNKGINCIKGYFLSKIMYGQDRLKTPLLRKKNGVYAKDGDFTPVSWDEAFDVMEEKYKAALKAKGPTSIGMFGSGQWTALEGYAAVKLMKAGFRSNNIEPNARHCMASAVAVSCARSASTSRWAATTTSNTPMRSCCGARTWRKCTRSCGHGSPTAG